jgi:hypothetical protein
MKPFAEQREHSLLTAGQPSGVLGPVLAALMPRSRDAAAASASAPRSRDRQCLSVPPPATTVAVPEHQASISRVCAVR